MLGEISLRSDHGKANIGANPHGHHILGDLLAQANTGIVALSCNIDESPFHIDLDLDIGVPRQSFRKLWPYKRHGGMITGRDPNGAGRLWAKRVQRCKFRLDFLEAWSHRT